MGLRYGIEATIGKWASGDRSWDFAADLGHDRPLRSLSLTARAGQKGPFVGVSINVWIRCESGRLWRPGRTSGRDPEETLTLLLFATGEHLGFASGT